MSQPFYITTPIYYPNGEPHLGHVYTTLAADTIARYQRLKGRDALFVTGTDEHGVKMVKTAAEQNISPAQLADKNAGVFRAVWQELGVSNDDFIRTTEARHKQSVQHIITQLQAKGDLYLGAYEGWYDEGQEEFVTETEAKARQFKAFNGKSLVRYREPTYFFRLSKYAPQVQKYIEAHAEFVQPASRRNEVLSKLYDGVDDLSISRSTLKWGIPLPHDPEHVVYVWIDALANYISVLGYGSEDRAKFDKYWPADVHLIGKEILWFHAVYWPALLMSLELPLPRMLFAHGWWTAGGRKMSKSEGNFIDLAKLRELCAAHGRDALRYYLLRAAPFGGDLDFSQPDFLKAFKELADVVGNCLNRVAKMIGQYRGGAIPAVGELTQADNDLLAKAARLPGELDEAYAACELQKCVMLPVELARAANGYIDANAPWKLAKDPAQAARLDSVLAVSVQAIHAALVGLLAVLPDKAPEGLRQLGVSVAGKSAAELFALPPQAGAMIVVGEPLFPKLPKAGAETK